MKKRELERALESKSEMLQKLLLAHEAEAKRREELEEQLCVLNKKYSALLKANIELLEKMHTIMKSEANTDGRG